MPLIATLAVTVVHLREKPERGPTVRFHFSPTERVTFRPYDSPVVSPDGGQIAFTGLAADTRTHLWVQPLDSLSTEMFPGTEGATFPFWSPDSKSIAFFAVGKLKRIDLSGGPPQTVCDTPGGWSGAWNPDGVILFGNVTGGPLYRVSATGGEPKPASELDPSRQETSHRYPEFLPDGRHFLYYALSSQSGNGGVYVGSLDSKERKRILASESAAGYSPAGGLLYVRGGAIMAQQFDWKRLELAGDPMLVAQQAGVFSSPGGFAAFSVSQNGVLTYRPSSGGNTELIWFDRHGSRGRTVGLPAEYSNPSLSPDGSRLAAGRMDPQVRTRDLWVFDLKSGTSFRLTLDPADELNPVWTLDGRRIFFTSDRKGIRDIYEKPANGIGTETVVLESKQQKSLDDLSPDGRYLVYDTGGPGGTFSNELWILPLFGDRKSVPFVHGEFRANQAQFSPNGRFIAYASNESGASEVYVQTFPEQGGKWPISTDGGTEPAWRHDGKELFYIGQTKLMAVEVKTDANSFQPGIPKPLFDIPLLPQTTARNRYVVTPDGQRFLFSAAAKGGDASMINVVVNWPAELRK